MATTNIVTLDLKFQGMQHAIAAYLIRHSSGAVLIESGPGSTQAALEGGLSEHGLAVSDVTHVLLTHIHLDHAGAAGWLAQHGAQIYVHPIGAPHLLHPERLLASAARIYGDQMQSLWGEFLPVPERQLNIAEDGHEIAIGNLRFIPINTPGHAEHHHVYVYEDVCFTGDVGGVRIPGYHYLRLPMPPPELHFGKWRESVRRLRQEHVAHLAPTHFGIYDDPEWQLQAVEREIDETERWLERAMQGEPSNESLREQFTSWMNQQGLEQGLSESVVTAYALANPPGMSADGLQRYWKKVRMAA